MDFKPHFYEYFGQFFESNDEYIESEINNKLYDTQKITIKIYPYFSQNKNRKNFKIFKIDYNGSEDAIRNTISGIKNHIEKQTEESDSYKVGDHNIWSVFYLLKELITAFSNAGYNFYRGQGSDWITRPGIFRDLISITSKSSDDEIYFYKEFEKHYQQIAREYPDDIKYIELQSDSSEINDNHSIDERADELATLQHYGLPTSLLDITENPFIALLFMLQSDTFFKPQIEFYKFDIREDTTYSLLTYAHKRNSNKRIKAQKGAFINYDKIDRFIEIGTKNELQLKSQYKKINRILVKIVLDFDEYVNYLNELKEENIKIEDTEESQKENKEVIQKEIDKYTASSEKNDIEKQKKRDEIINQQYMILHNELLKKLNEFHYFTRDLSPDFHDYLIHLNKGYKRKDKDKKPDSDKFSDNII